MTPRKRALEKERVRKREIETERETERERKRERKRERERESWFNIVRGCKSESEIIL